MCNAHRRLEDEAQEAEKEKTKNHQVDSNARGRTDPPSVEQWEEEGQTTQQNDKLRLNKAEAVVIVKALLPRAAPEKKL